MKSRMIRRAAWVATASFLAVGAPEGRAAGKNPDPPPTVTVLGQKLELKNKKAGRGEDLLAEYVPAAETLDTWTRMFAVRIHHSRLTPEQAASAKAQEIAARRAQGDLLANSVGFAKGETRVIDFLLSQNEIVEQDIIKYAPYGDGRLVSYQLARRYYRFLNPINGNAVDPDKDHEDMTAFLGEIKTGRNAWIAELDRVSEGVLK
jgi:hypothetical protein